MEKITELETKLKDREQAIGSLEQTVEQHVKAMHSLQAEMQCMMETQRIKEKNTQAIYLRKGTFLQEQLSSLQDDIQKKEKKLRNKNGSPLNIRA